MQDMIKTQYTRLLYKRVVTFLGYDCVTVQTLLIADIKIKRIQRIQRIKRTPIYDVKKNLSLLLCRYKKYV